MRTLLTSATRRQEALVNPAHFLSVLTQFSQLSKCFAQKHLKSRGGAAQIHLESVRSCTQTLGKWSELRKNTWKEGGIAHNCL